MTKYVIRNRYMHT